VTAPRAVFARASAYPMHEAAAEDATFINVRAEISLHLLAYNMKRVMRILGMGPLMAAIQT
jgi:hypothetical protein